MAIDKELEKYADERAFTCDFLIPLLGRLGFYVTYYHGTREYGRDLIFSEIDRFGSFTYHGLQAKREASIGLRDSEELIRQCGLAFRHPFQHPVTGAMEYICSFVVANAGNYSEGAGENFHAEARNLTHAGSVRLLDGRALIELDKRATVARVEQVADILTGLLHEVVFNRIIAQSVLAELNDFVTKQKLPGGRFRTTAVSHYLERPLLPALIQYDLVSDYENRLETGVNTKLNVWFGIGNKDESIKWMIEHINIAMAIGNVLIDSIQRAMATLGPLAAS